jgi:SAM-dependent methyltransferase
MLLKMKSVSRNRRAAAIDRNTGRPSPNSDPLTIATGSDARSERECVGPAGEKLVSMLLRIVELGHSFQAAKALLSAVELGVFTALADEPLSAETLCEQTGMCRRGARDFFDALVALNLIERDENGRYVNTSDGARYLDRRKPTYVGGAFELLSSRHFGAWASLTAALRGKGAPQRMSSGHYPELYGNPAMLDAFAEGMTGGCRLVAPAIVERFPWREHQRVIDIGTAEGCLPAEIASAHPHVCGGGFDLPVLKPLFDNYVNARGLSNRLKFYPGDFFADALPTADVLIMGRILHNWDLAAKKMLLRKAYDALSPGGALIICERLIDDQRRTATAALLMSLHMLMMTAGGFAFTAADCIDWMREAGFADVDVTQLAVEYSMVVGFKPRR